MADDLNIPPSRLSESTAQLRKELVSRNLYAPDTQYPLKSKNVVTSTVNAINGIIGAITPFKSYNLENTTYGRLLTGNEQTPLTTIGLAMLAKQFAYNAASSISQDNIPIIKIGNLFDGKSTTKLFTKRIEYSITIKTGNTKFQNFLNSAAYSYSAKDYSFNENSSNSDFIENTGSGQLQFLYKHINKNLFKQNWDSSNTVFYDYADKVMFPITNSDTLINKNKKGGIFFSLNPLAKYSGSIINSIDTANNNMINAVNNNNAIYSEYGIKYDYIERLGTPTKKLGKTYIASKNEWISTETEFVNNQDKNENKIVWGRDGIDWYSNDKLNFLRGEDTITGVDDEKSSAKFITDFKAENGLLQYTRNLVIATQGRVADITRKAFVDVDDNIVGFQGSGLYRANNSNYAKKSGIADKKGVRQHTVLDQYNRFAKAIRFNGNVEYNGNSNSVIYKSVLPRIHPTIDNINNQEVLNNKNLMLSIENLAVNIFANPEDGVGITDDEYGSAIPACEVGPFNGRIMWFPPYNMEIQETSTAKYEPTVMVGRNEPMYNYQNSERTATINFTLLIDYPPQVKNYKTHKEMAEFFTFGGDSNTPDKTYIDNLQYKLTLIQIEIDKIRNKKPPELPDLENPNEQYLYFPNDIPKPNDILNTIVDDMYKTYTYEIIDNFPSCDGDSFGLNRHIFYITGVSKTIVGGKTIQYFTTPPTKSQYTAIETTDQYGEVTLNKILKEKFENEDHRKYFDIIIEGGASKLYTEGNPKDVEEEIEYNKALGKRRADATKILVERRLVEMFGANVLKDINIKVTSKGSISAKDVNATKKRIPERPTKEERFAKISIVKNDNYAQPKEVPLTTQEKIRLDILIVEMERIQQLINDGHNVAENCVMKERTIGGTTLNGFKSITDNYYSPVFHSQTPEDFHKRLTFLQQCTRQGSAIKYDSKVDANGILRAKNSVFGRQPICILRVGDFWYTKVIIETVNVDYSETTWDTNPEGFGMQPMIAKVTLNMKVIGGQSLKGPIDALQNAATYNYYANSNYTKDGRYLLPSAIADLQDTYRNGITAENAATIQEFNERNADYKKVVEQQNNNNKNLK